ncbi:MAG: O-antigen ligase family protein [Nitrospirota bacterium]
MKRETQQTTAFVLSFMRLLLVATAILPLLMAHSLFFPYISGKVFFLRFSVTLVAILFTFRFIQKPSFREEMREKLNRLLKDGLFLSVLAYFIIFVLTAIPAVNWYWAFYGSIERGEGVVGMLFFFGFFLFSVLLFRDKDWLLFFKIGLGVAIILFFDAMKQYLNGVNRPASYAGHPIYLGVYFLFVIFSSWIIYFSTERDDLFWRLCSVLIVPFCLVGILIAEARGAMVGIAAGSLATTVYLAIYGKDEKWKTFTLRQIACFLLVGLVLSGSLFLTTRENPFWQKIPGIDRLARISMKDSTTVSRLLTAKVAIRSVDPREGNIEKFFLGWGPENFLVAWNQYFDPEIFQHDSASLDRAHNKLLDVMVMNGIFGLLSYLAVWICAFKLTFSKGMPVPCQSALLFFGISYFVQNLFVFDSVVTYIPFFAYLSFLIFISSKDYPNVAKAK